MDIDPTTKCGELGGCRPRLKNTCNTIALICNSGGGAYRISPPFFSFLFFRLSLPMEQKLRESGYLLNMEEEEVEAEHVGCLQRRQPRPTNNFEDSAVSAVLVPAGTSTAGSYISTITDEEQEPEPEPVHEQVKRHEPDDGFQVDVEHSVSNASPGDGHPVAALGEGDGAVAEGNDGKGIGEVEEEELKKSFPLEKEHDTGSVHEHQKAEHGDVGFLASKMDLIFEECDPTAEKLNVREDLIKNFHEISDRGVGISASWKVPVDGVVCDLTAEISETREVLSTLSDEQESVSEVRLPSPRKSYQEETAISFIEEVEPVETEYDVEGVLKKQNTHELFCPNCHSCITRKVILRRRRKVLRFPPQGRGERVRVTSGRSGVESITEAGDRSPDVAFATPASDALLDATEDRGKVGEPEVFRCLSCFTFFIPTGDGFKVFRIFEKRREAGTIPESQELPAAVATEKTSFLSFFPRKKKPAVLEASENKTEEKTDSGMDDDSLLNGRSSSVLAAESRALSKQLPSEKDAILEPKKVEESSPDSLSKDTASSLKEPPSIISDQFNTYREGLPKNLGSSSPDTANSLKEPVPVIIDQFNTYLGEPPAENDRNLEDVVTKPKPAEVIAPLNSVSIVIGQSIISIDQTTVKETEKDLPIKNELSVVTEVSSLSQSQSSIAKSKVVVADSLIFPSPLEKLKDDAVKEPEEPEEPIKKSTGDGVIVEIERAPASQTTPTGDTLRDVENPPQVDTQTPPSDTRATEVLEAHDFDILKSIVYGGLVESIASLGVVSSAAGGGAATLNTFALALANLITGLFVLVHNIRELKNEQSSGAETQPDVEGDRYYQQLGRRGKFSLHLSIAVVSYLVFGLVAPITYGFSFRESDDRDYKLAVVAAASLLCILLLALAKAHVRSKSYIKTALYYLVMGFAASGISFLVGELVDKLLERLGLFDSASSSTSVSGGLREMPLPVSGWALY